MCSCVCVCVCVRARVYMYGTTGLSRLSLPKLTTSYPRAQSARSLSNSLFGILTETSLSVSVSLALSLCVCVCVCTCVCQKVNLDSLESVGHLFSTAPQTSRDSPCQNSQPATCAHSPLGIPSLSHSPSFPPSRECERYVMAGKCRALSLHSRAASVLLCVVGCVLAQSSCIVFIAHYCTE